MVFVVVAAPWYLAMWWLHGTDYLAGFFVGDNLERFATDRFNEPRPWWYYGPVVVGGLVPWAPFLLLGLGAVGRMATGRGGAGSLETRLALWIVVPLLLLSVSVGKQPRYVLPLLPPLALLVAHGIMERTRARRGLDGGLYRQPPDRAVQVGSLVAGLILAVAGALGVAGAAALRRRAAVADHGRSRPRRRRRRRGRRDGVVASLARRAVGAGLRHRCGDAGAGHRRARRRSRRDGAAGGTGGDRGAPRRRADRRLPRLRAQPRLLHRPCGRSTSSTTFNSTRSCGRRAGPWW